MRLVSLDAHREQQREHRHTVHRAARRLREIRDELLDLAVQVALTGPLRKWDEEQPIGAVVNILDVLADVRDGRVVALLQLREAVGTAVDHLHERA